jgi:osmotically-inducible protein OsmY
MVSRSVVTLVAGIAAAAAAASIGGCSVMQEKTFGESLDEAASGTDIKTRLFRNGGMSRFGEVDVEVAGRFVLLSGRVPSEADKAEAERIAWSVSAVDEVANELVITKGDFGRDMNDRWITEQVRWRIVGDSEVKGVNYNIQVFDGVVYLLGLAQTEDELRRAAEHASKVQGVKKVVSYVKMRERAAPTTQAAVQQPGLPPVQQPGPPPVQQPHLQPGATAQIAPPADQAAPIVPPDRPPTTREQYKDPYEPGATPPPGANNNSLGLESAPLPPAN